MTNNLRSARCGRNFQHDIHDFTTSNGGHNWCSGNLHVAPPEETRVTSPTGGEKGTKPARFDLIPPGPLTQLAEMYGAGAEKYETKRNWEKGYDWSLTFAALQRHAWAFWGGEDNDPETGKPHAAAVAFHAFALLHFMEHHRDYDDRPTT